KEGKKIDLGDSYPNGFVAENNRAYVALSTKNQIAEVDLEAGKVLRTLDVDIAPFNIAWDEDSGKLYVTEQGGIAPKPGEASAPSAGTAVAVDKRGILKAGALAEVDLDQWRVTRRIPLPTLPTEVAIDDEHGSVLVSCANG